MECPRCSARMKRLRTIDKGSTVIRYNGCSKCGEKAQSVEMFLVEYQADKNNMATRAAKAENDALQLSLNLQTIQTAFTALRTAVEPAEEKDMTGPASRFTSRYTKAWRFGRG